MAKTKKVEIEEVSIEKVFNSSISSAGDKYYYIYYNGSSEPVKVTYNHNFYVEIFQIIASSNMAESVHPPFVPTRCQLELPLAQYQLGANIGL